MQRHADICGRLKRDSARLRGTPLSRAAIERSRAARRLRASWYAPVNMDDARKVRDFWFGKTPLAAEQLPRRMKLWFGDVPEETQQQIDYALRERFGSLVERAINGELAQW